MVDTPIADQQYKFAKWKSIRSYDSFHKYSKTYSKSNTFNDYFRLNYCSEVCFPQVC